MIAAKLRRKRIKDPICSFLKKLISPYSLGWEEDGRIRRHTDEQLIRWKNKNGFMPSPSNGDLYAHFAGQETLYFCGDGRFDTDLALVMIDIDCHGRGDARSARAFAAWLRDNYFPNLYHEVSTHGTGRHGYFLLSKEKTNALAVRIILKSLDKTLKRLLRYFLATHPDFEVENVEIKGTPPSINWERGQAGRMQIRSMRSGEFAKIPREILDRFEEFKATSVLRSDDIRTLASTSERLVIPEVGKPVIFRANGSTPSHPMPKDEVEAIGGPYLEFAGSWVKDSLGTSSRARVEAADLAIALGIVKFCTSKPNADGSMPTARIKAIWDKLFDNGEVDRAFDYHRWKIVRDVIEAQGGLEMVDRRYYTGGIDEGGRTIRGRAAKWHMASWLVDTLDGIPCNLSQPGSCDSLPNQRQGGSLLEHNEEVEEIHGFDDNWIVQFLSEGAKTIGLIWGGHIQETIREAG